MDKMEKEFKKVEEKLNRELEYMKEENDKIKKRLTALEIL